MIDLENYNLLYQIYELNGKYVLRLSRNWLWYLIERQLILEEVTQSNSGFGFVKLTNLSKEKLVEILMVMTDLIGKHENKKGD